MRARMESGLISRGKLLRWLRKEEKEFARRAELDRLLGRDSPRALDAAHHMQFVIGHVSRMKDRR